MNNIDLDHILTQDEIEAAWGSSIKQIPKTSFAIDDVPHELRALVPYAVVWGAADDWAREDILKHTPVALKRNLKQAISRFDDQLDIWLAGPEASSSNPTDAYIAFSAMRMGADYI